MEILASMQSTGPEILKNIKRAHISCGEFYEFRDRNHEMNAKPFVELILGLPGDIVVRMHYLITLPRTKMLTPKSKKHCRMETKYRVAAQSFVRYRVFSESFITCEYDKICTTQDTISFEEYIDCRMSDLALEITHNGNVFRELYELCGAWGWDWAELISTMHENLDDLRPILKTLYGGFSWESMAKL